jgi:site-specific DNA-adenine methylase
MMPLFTVKSCGSKARLIPVVLNSLAGPPWPETIVEPFGGSAVVGLTLLSHGYCRRLVIGEADLDYLAFWRAALGDSDFARRVSVWTNRAYRLPLAERRRFVLDSLEQMKVDDHGFWMLLRSRITFKGMKKARLISDRQRNGILFCWPRHLPSSLNLLHSLRNRITVLDDGFGALAATNRQTSFAFVDPPYSMTPTCPAHEIYDEAVIDHRKLLSVLNRWKGRYVLTYNVCRETRQATANLSRTKSYFYPARSGGAAVGTVNTWDLLVVKSEAAAN